MTLDLVKGELVVVMAIYHTMNVFSTAGPGDYAYIRFVSGSFVLLSGYIIGRFQLTSFEKGWRGVSQALALRGVRLMILFTLLNLLIGAAGIGNPAKSAQTLEGFWWRSFDIFVAGRPKAAAFQILLPLGYLLIASPALLFLRRRANWLLSGSACVLLFLSVIDVSSINLEFLMLGLIGVAGGIMLNVEQNRSVQLGAAMSFPALVFAIYIMKYLSLTPVTSAVGTIAILLLFYDLSKSASHCGGLAQIGATLGQYSLFCYVAQILFLQLLSRAIGKPLWPLGPETCLITLATVAFLAIACAGLGRLRKKYMPVAFAYNMLFA